LNIEPVYCPKILVTNQPALHYNSQGQGPVGGLFTNIFSTCKGRTEIFIFILQCLFLSLSFNTEHGSKTSIFANTSEMPVIISPAVL